MFFDESTTDMSFYDDMMKNPAYYKRAKNLKYRIKHIRPFQYFEECAAISSSYLKEDITALDEMRVLIRDLYVKYAQAMLDGEKFPLPVLDYAGQTQEGRHRAMAAHKAGAKEMPVMMVTTANG